MYTTYSNSVGPWRRWAARTIDLHIEFIIVFIIIQILGVSTNPLGEIFLDLFMFLLAFLLDTCVYAVCGNTLGKWCFGIRAVKNNDQRLTAVEYLKRNLRVYWGGLGLCFILAPLFTQIYQYNRVSKGQRASYDELLDTKVIRYCSSTLKEIIGILLILSPFVLAILVSMVMVFGGNLRNMLEHTNNTLEATKPTENYVP